MPAVVLFVCTGNLCRSPSAEWFLTQRLSAVGPPDVVVESAGTLGTSSTVPAGLLQAGIEYGLDLNAHVPRRVDVETVKRADVVIGMARQHVRDVVLIEPSAFAKSFTLREFVRRGRYVGQRRRHQLMTEWLEQLGSGRRHIDLIEDSPMDDVPDPMGGDLHEFQTMLTELATLTRTLHSLIWP